MVKLYIPQVGDTLKLSQNWDCKIFNEYRNEKIFKGLHIEPEKNTNVDVTFPKGTVLKVARLYVRAPASSFDSITFIVDSSPIKSLNKARFWVKLMDANTIEFEEVKITIDSYVKIKDAFRFLALKNEFQNSERLNAKDSSFVAKELFEYFKNKNNNEIVLKFPVSVEEIFNEIKFERSSYYRQQAYYDKNQARLEEARNVSKGSELTLHLLPVLNGFIYYFEQNQEAIDLDKYFDLLNKVDDSHWGHGYFGSKLSHELYEKIDDKSLPLMIEKMSNDFKAEVFYAGEKQDISSLAELNKFIKKVRIK